MCQDLDEKLRRHVELFDPVVRVAGGTNFNGQVKKASGCHCRRDKARQGRNVCNDSMAAEDGARQSDDGSDVEEPVFPPEILSAVMDKLGALSLKRTLLNMLLLNHSCLELGTHSLLRCVDVTETNFGAVRRCFGNDPDRARLVHELRVESMPLHGKGLERLLEVFTAAERITIAFRTNERLDAMTSVCIFAAARYRTVLLINAALMIPTTFIAYASRRTELLCLQSPTTLPVEFKPEHAQYILRTMRDAVPRSQHVPLEIRVSELNGSSTWSLEQLKKFWSAVPNAKLMD